MKLIITSGMPGAGKEEFLIAVSGIGIPFVRMGDVVREHYAKRDGKDADLSTGQFASAERERYGFDIWAKRTLEKIDGDIFIIDGCRSGDEIEIYKKMAGDVSVIGIYASPKTRYDRLVKRGRDDAPKNHSEFIERDRREMSWGLAETLALADYQIINEGTLAEFKKDVIGTMEKLRK